MIKVAMWILVAIIMIFVADRCGFLVLQMKRALTYTASMDGKKARFSACSGYTKRSLYFPESRIYHFELLQELTKGNVSVEIFDYQKQQILLLDGETKTGDIDAQKGKRYCMIVRFKGATGRYEIDWQ